MKNTFKVLGIIALVAVIGFSLVACGGEDDGGGSGGTVKYPDGMTDADKPTRFSVSTLTATINSGKVDIVFGEPIRATYTVGDWLNEETGHRVTANPSDAKFSPAKYFHSDGYEYYLICLKEDLKGSWVYLIYADKDATIKGTRDSNKVTYIGGNRTEYHETRSVDASLKKGWNYWIVNRSGTTTERTYTETASTNIPGGFKWFVIDREGLISLDFN